MSDAKRSLVVVTGMSGGGRKTAAGILEELGWYVADNLPPELIIELVKMAFTDGPGGLDRLAIVTDVRSRSFVGGSIIGTLDWLESHHIKPVVLFVDADDETLIKRFDTVRRKHPLQGSETLQTGLRREREVLAAVRDRADIIIDTSTLSIHDLYRQIERTFREIPHDGAHITVESFGFKHGAPRDADIVLDARFLPNPYWEPELRAFRGTDREVSDYVLGQEGAEEYIDAMMTVFRQMLRGYAREGKNFTTIAVGCTGGHHRSVAVAEEFARRLRAEGQDVTVVHRDFSRD